MIATQIVADAAPHGQQSNDQSTTPAESGPRERLHTEPATPWSLRVSAVERVLEALESHDAPFDAYAALQCMPLAQAMRLAASRPAPVFDRDTGRPFASAQDTLIGGVGRVSAGEFHAVGGGK
jgi:hypothetical protein